MRKFVMIMAVLVQTMFLSCATAWQNTAYTDDLYSVHNKIDIANKQKRAAELAKAQYEAQQAEYEAALAKIKLDAIANGATVNEVTSNGYDSVLADTYESAYARRLYGFSSPTYRMPSSYYTWRYSDAFHYASAYDPAFYNIMVSGDMIWVEPKYITSMFGSWGAVAVPAYGCYYGWNSPFYSWNYPYNYGLSWSWNWGWHHPYYWGWGYPYHRYPHHRPPYHRPPHHRPPYAGSGSVGNTGHHHNRPGMVVGRNPGASRPVSGGGSVRPSQPSSGRGSQSGYRGSGSSSGRYSGGSSSYGNNGSSSYRGSSSGGSSSYRAPSAPSRSSSPSYSGGGNSRGR